jgi:nanoRNase/pAp phosphatase (c-di-AMP/oligoRNAs hydrolase)
MSHHHSAETILEGTSLDASAEVDQLPDCLAGTERLAIVCHDNPDPDCPASGLALELIANETDVTDVTLLYCGESSTSRTACS